MPVLFIIKFRVCFKFFSHPPVLVSLRTKNCSYLYGYSTLYSRCSFSKALQAGQLDIISKNIHHDSLEQLVSSPESLKFSFFVPENNYDDDTEIYAVMESARTTNWGKCQIAIAVLSPPSTDTLTLLF